MGKKSRERRERHEQRMVEVQMARVAQSGRLFDDLLDSDSIWRDFINKRPAHPPIIVIDDVYSQLREMDDFQFPFSREIWQRHLVNNIIPPFGMCFVEFSYNHKGGAIEKSGALIAFENDINLWLLGFIEYDGLIGSAVSCRIHCENGVFSSITSESNDNVYALSYNPWFAILYALQLLNCRNIELVDHEPDPAASREYERHFGRPLTKYKTLQIKPTGKQYEGGEQKPYQGIMPLHIRRGNFATYTDDAPLFGKYTGTFWRPATAVGERDNGIVVKDYEVIAPDE